MENKNIILEEIQNEIYNIIDEMQKVNIDSYEYQQLSLKKDVLDKEYEEIKKMDNTNIAELFSGLTSYKFLDKYLINDNIELFLLNLYKNKDKKNDEYKSIINGKEVDDVLTQYKEEIKNYEKTKNEFYASIKNFDFGKYMYIKKYLVTNDIILYEELDKLLGVGADGLINKLQSKAKEIMNKKLLPLNSREKEIDEMIKSKIPLLLSQIEDYIKKAYTIYQSRLGINVEKNSDFVKYYNSILTSIFDKNDYYRELEQKLNNLKEENNINKREFIISLKSIGIVLDELKEEEKDLLMSINYEDLLKYITSKSISDRLLYSYNKELK